MTREYNEEMSELGTVYTVHEWNQLVCRGLFKSYDGNGFWCKKAAMSRDEVFSTPSLDATHVIWFNR